MISQDNLIGIAKIILRRMDSWVSIAVRWVAVAGLLLAAYSAVTSTARNWIDDKFTSAVTEIFDSHLDSVLEKFYVDEVLNVAMEEANRVATAETARIMEQTSFGDGGLYPEIYGWRGGMEARQMLEVEEGICFLTRVSGEFEAPGDYVSVFDSGGSWYLDGESPGNSVGAEARCWRFPEKAPATQQ